MLRILQKFLNFFIFLDLFAVDRQTNFLRNIAPFDRESQFFADYLVPQIQIKLELVCESASSLSVDVQNVSAFSELVHFGFLAEGIYYSKSITYLNIIIVDQNDNFPVFNNPSDGTYIGFPDASLTEKLMPRYLIDIDAFDLDDGLNAKIKYSLSNSEDFSIDPETGIIYPLKSCMVRKDAVDITVIATDRNGASDGNAQQVILSVKKVQAENVAVLIIEDQKLEDVDQLLRDISVSSAMDVRAFNYFAVPSDQENEGKQMSPLTKIMIFTYAFNEEKNLLSASDIVETLSDAELSSLVTFSTFNDSIYKPSVCNLTGLIVAVSVLGSLLLIISIGTPLIWFLWLRFKIKGSSRRSSELSVKDLEDDFNDNMVGRSSPMTEVVTNDNESLRDESTKSDAEIVGIQIDGATQGKIKISTN